MNKGLFALVGIPIAVICGKIAGSKHAKEMKAKKKITKDEIVKRLKKNPEYYFLLKEEYGDIERAMWREAVSEVGIDKVNEAIIQSSLKSFELS